jgi:hypothetical protein
MNVSAEPLQGVRLSTGRLEGARQTLENALIVTRREVRDSLRDWRIIAPIIVLTFFFPYLAQFIGVRRGLWRRSDWHADDPVSADDRRLLPDLDFTGDRARDVRR